jgi:NADH-quinone oxidoreductase subunit C
MADDEPEPAALADPVREALLQELGDSIVGHEITKGDLCVRVDRRAWRRTGEVLKGRLGFDYFCFLSGIDWMQNPDLSSRHEKTWDPEPGADSEDTGTGGDGDRRWQTGVAGGDTRFQVFARVYSVDRHAGVTLKADLDDERPEVDSWVPLYRGADWHERETWEMFGFDFAGHPGLRHMYLPGEFEGHPLRKDFPLLARARVSPPGLVDKEPVPGEADSEGDES